MSRIIRSLLRRYPAATQTIENQAAAAIPLVIKGHASQSADLFVVENSAGTDLVVVEADGDVRIISGATTGTALTVTAGGLTIGAGLYINAAASSTGKALVTSNSLSGTSGKLYGNYLQTVAAPGSAASASYVGLISVVSTSAGDNIDSSMMGLQGLAQNDSTSGSVYAMNGVVGSVNQVAAGTLGIGICVNAFGPYMSAGAITNMHGFYASNQGASGVTNAYGLYVAAQSGAATKNIGAYIGSTVGIGVDPTSDSNAILELSKGINFPNTAVASTDANTLDDYEEGDWTPGVSFGGGTTGITGTFNGRYVKIGKWVLGSFEIIFTAKGSSTGAAALTGLPFASAAPNDSRGGSMVSYYADMASLNGLVPFVEASATIAYLRIPGAATMASATDANFTNTSTLYGLVVYEAAS